MKTIIIPESVNSIGKGCFLSCANLESIYIRNNIDHIGENAFAHSTKLTNVTYMSGTVPLCEEDVFEQTAVEKVSVLVWYPLNETFCEKNVETIYSLQEPPSSFISGKDFYTSTSSIVI